MEKFKLRNCFKKIKQIISDSILQETAGNFSLLTAALEIPEEVGFWFNNLSNNVERCQQIIHCWIVLNNPTVEYLLQVFEDSGNGLQRASNSIRSAISLMKTCPEIVADENGEPTHIPRLRQLLATSKLFYDNQSLLISGEIGVGKTHFLKRLLHLNGLIDQDDELSGRIVVLDFDSLPTSLEKARSDLNITLTDNPKELIMEILSAELVDILILDGLNVASSEQVAIAELCFQFQREFYFRIVVVSPFIKTNFSERFDLKVEIKPFDPEEAQKFLQNSELSRVLQEHSGGNAMLLLMIYSMIKVEMERDEDNAMAIIQRLKDAINAMNLADPKVLTILENDLYLLNNMDKLLAALGISGVGHPNSLITTHSTFKEIIDVWTASNCSVHRSILDLINVLNDVGANECADQRTMDRTSSKFIQKLGHDQFKEVWVGSRKRTFPVAAKTLNPEAISRLGNCETAIILSSSRQEPEASTSPQAATPNSISFGVKQPVVDFVVRSDELKDIFGKMASSSGSSDTVSNQLQGLAKANEPVSKFEEFGRHLRDMLVAELRDNRVPTTRLYDYQIKALQATAEHYNIYKNKIKEENDEEEAKFRKALIVAPPGSGKSGMVVLLPYYLDSKKVLVLTPSKIISEQLASEFGYPDINKGFFIKAGVVKIEDVKSLKNLIEQPHLVNNAKDMEVLDLKTLVIANVQKFGGNFGSSLSSCKTQAEIDKVRKQLEDFDTIIVDEAHHCPAPTWKLVLEVFDKKKVVFLTSTPFHGDQDMRKDEKLKLVHEIHGKELEGKTIRKIEFIEKPATPETLIGPEFLELLAGDITEQLNKHAGQETRAAENPRDHPQAMILVRTKKEAQEVAGGLGETATYIISDKCSDQNLIDFTGGKKKIAVVCGRLREGYDNSNVTLVVILRKVKSRVLFEQFCGRCMRMRRDLTGKHSDKTVGTVLSYSHYDLGPMWSAIKKIAETDPVEEEEEDEENGNDNLQRHLPTETFTRETSAATRRRTDDEGHSSHTPKNPRMEQPESQEVEME